METDFIEVFDHGSSYHCDPLGHEVKESEAKAHGFASNEARHPFNPLPSKISFEPPASKDFSLISSNSNPTLNSIFKSVLMKTSQLDLSFIDSLDGG